MLSFISLALLTCVDLCVEAGETFLRTYVVGDSHSLEFKGIPNCQTHHFRTHTMHRIGRDGLSGLNLTQLGVREGQAVVFAFGEIDARCHIGKQRDKFNRSLDEIIDTLVSNYIHTIALNRNLYSDLTCIIYSVTPPAYHIYDPTMPQWGTIEDRIAITKQLNQRLAEACHEMGFYFLDVYQDYADSQGSLVVELSDGNVHINSEHNGPIRNKLESILEDVKK